MREKHGRTAMVLLAAGLFLVLDRIFDPVTLAALTAVALGVYRASVRADGVGYAAMAAGTLFLMVAHWPLLVLLAVAASVFFYARARDWRRSAAGARFGGLVRSLRWERAPFVLSDAQVLSLVGEVRIDLSLAMPERPETTVELEGIVGDVRLIVPDDWRVEVEGFAVFGEFRAPGRRESGLWHRFVWRSPGRPTFDGDSGPVMKLVVRYFVADVEIIRM